MQRDEEKRSLRPWLMAVAVIAVVGLGFWGFAMYHPTAPALDHFYRTLQLFVLESGDMAAAPPWQLEIARLAAPALTVISALVVAAALSQDRIDRWRAHRLRGHVVVCGLGRHGAPASLALQRAGHEVVGVEIAASSSGITRCRHARIPVIVGDARDPSVLAQAGVHTADHLVLLGSSLALGGQVALAAIGLVEQRDSQPLTIHLEVDRPELATLLRSMAVTEHRATSWYLEELDLSGVRARSMLDEQSPWQSDDHPAHVLVAGASRLGIAVVTQLARRRRYGGGKSPLFVTVLDRDPTARQRLPQHLHGATVRVVAEMPAVPDPGEAGSGPWPSAPPVTAAYVCHRDEAVALAASLVILRELPGIPVLVRLEQAGALGEILRRDMPDLRVVSLDERVPTPQVLLDSTNERIVRALHDVYRRTAADDDPSAAAWDALPEALRASNRAQAAHVAEKLRATGRVLVPDDGEPPDAFTQEEVEVLGQFEHERWMQERLAAGWRSGPRDSMAKTSPYLVPWGSLDEEVREIDRRFVRALPDVLADAGLVIRRAGPVGAPTLVQEHAD